MQTTPAKVLELSFIRPATISSLRVRHPDAQADAGSNSSTVSSVCALRHCLERSKIRSHLQGGRRFGTRVSTTRKFPCIAQPLAPAKAQFSPITSRWRTGLLPPLTRNIAVSSQQPRPLSANPITSPVNSPRLTIIIGGRAGWRHLVTSSSVPREAPQFRAGRTLRPCRTI